MSFMSVTDDSAAAQADLVTALLCVVCGLGAAVRVRKQTFCGRCALEYQVSQVARREATTD